MMFKKNDEVWIKVLWQEDSYVWGHAFEKDEET